jgi:hypothetical protein
LTPFVYAAVLILWPHSLPAWLVVLAGIFVLSLFVTAGLLHIRDLGGWTRMEEYIHSHLLPSIAAIVIICCLIFGTGAYLMFRPSRVANTQVAKAGVPLAPPQQTNQPAPTTKPTEKAKLKTPKAHPATPHIQPTRTQTQPEQSTPLAVPPLPAPLSDTQLKELSARHGPLFYNFIAVAGSKGTAFLDRLPCDHTFANTVAVGGKAGMVYDPVGICLDKVNHAEEQKNGRHVSIADKAKLIPYLAEIKGRIEIFFAGGEDESKNFASEWYEIFKAAGWEMKDNAPVPGVAQPDSYPSGIAAQLPGTGTCLPADDKTTAGRAMYAISSRTGVIGVSCSDGKDKSLIMVLIGSEHYDKR